MTLSAGSKVGRPYNIVSLRSLFVSVAKEKRILA
jgi:hypothetical protein